MIKIKLADCCRCDTEVIKFFASPHSDWSFLCVAYNFPLQFGPSVDVHHLSILSLLKPDIKLWLILDVLCTSQKDIKLLCDKCAKIPHRSGNQAGDLLVIFEPSANWTDQLSPKTDDWYSWQADHTIEITLFDQKHTFFLLISLCPSLATGS